MSNLVQPPFITRVHWESIGYFAGGRCQVSRVASRSALDGCGRIPIVCGHASLKGAAHSLAVETKEVRGPPLAKALDRDA